MTKLIVVFFSILMILGCGDAKKDRKKVDKKQDAMNEQLTKNILMGDITLLAIKHGIAEEQLIKILDEYYKMTQGFSMIEFMSSFASKKEGIKLETEIGEVITISDALNRLSDKYNIPKPILSSIIIDKKMLECERGD
jgi:hypothetical protein